MSHEQHVSLDFNEFRRKYESVNLSQVVQPADNFGQYDTAQAMEEISTLKRQNEEMKCQLKALQQRSQELKLDHEHLVEESMEQLRMDSLQQQELQEEQAVCSSLMNQIEALQEEMIEAQSFLTPNQDIDKDYDDLCLATYIGMGVDTRLEGNDIKSFKLTSENKQDILTLPLETTPTYSSVKKTWDFISKDI